MVKIVFICDRNTVRSPMAAALLGRNAESYGLDADDYVDPFACAAMFEQGLDITAHQPKTVRFRDLKAGDIVITLSRNAFETARKWRDKAGFELEYWNLPEVPGHDAPRDMILDGYRAIIRAIKGHIDNRFTKGV